MEKLSKDLEESSNKPDIRAKGKIGWKLKIAIMSAFSILVAFMIISPTVSGPIYSNPVIAISVINIDENLSCYLILIGHIDNTSGFVEKIVLHPGDNHTIVFTGERGKDIEIQGFDIWGNESFIKNIDTTFYKVNISLRIFNETLTTSSNMTAGSMLFFLPPFHEKVNDTGQMLYKFSFSINSQQWKDRIDEWRKTL
jgi:hypothetical protein